MNNKKEFNNLQNEILKLKEEKNAIILAHNYQKKEIQEIADFIGDSLELCIKASEVKDKDLVVFCGVDFMAETAAILNPEKKILIPDNRADCPMANMLSAEELKLAKKRYPEAAVILYVNTLAEAKAEADILCTSANALKIVESVDNNQILFGPDANLASYVAKNTDKEIIPVPQDGHCYVHKMFSPIDLINLKETHNIDWESDDVEVLIHPESNPEVQDLADYILSTGGMLDRVKNSTASTFIIGTEIDMITRINMEVPGKKLVPLLDEAICKTMKLHTLEKVKNSLENQEYLIEVNEEVSKKSLAAVEKMIEVSLRK
ncbi:MAG: quinolinate synthase NadA [Methanobacteriaceae archaeon]